MRINDVATVRGQPKQELFLIAEEDFVFFGGEAGGGKSFGLLLSALQNIDEDELFMAIFRKSFADLDAPGSIFQEAKGLFPAFGARQRGYEFIFPSEYYVVFENIEDRRYLTKYQGAQLPIQGFDEITHIPWEAFSFLFSRNRNPTRRKMYPYVRATGNPDPDHWIIKFVIIYLDKEGFPIPELAGKRSYFIVEGDEVIISFDRADVEKEIDERGLGQERKENIKTFAFIPSGVDDNPEMLKKDPKYKANLDLLSFKMRRRLRDGCWFALPEGIYFKEEWFRFVEGNALPVKRTVIRWWDRASTDEKDVKNDTAAFTAGVKMSIDKDRNIYIEDVKNVRQRPMDVFKTINKTAEIDGRKCIVGLFQDPAQAGVFEMEVYSKALIGYVVKTLIEKGGKESRIAPFSSYAERGMVYIVKAKWNEMYLRQLLTFPGGHKDMVDASGGAFGFLYEKARDSVKATQSRIDTTASPLGEY